MTHDYLCHFQDEPRPAWVPLQNISRLAYLGVRRRLLDSKISTILKWSTVWNTIFIWSFIYSNHKDRTHISHDFRRFFTTYIFGPGSAMTRPPFTVLVEVRATLEKLGLSRHEAEADERRGTVKAVGFCWVTYGFPSFGWFWMIDSGNEFVTWLCNNGDFVSWFIVDS